MILSDAQIRAAVNCGDVVIDPFDPSRLGSNSYDITLAPTLGFYAGDGPLDAKAPNEMRTARMHEDGHLLVPNRLYLGVTREFVGSRKYVPWLDGKSSAGRLGISVHVTAGRGDVGYFGHWTLEIFVVQPVRVYPGMPIGQFTFFESGDVLVPYNVKPGAKYLTHRSDDPAPVSSMMWKNF